MCVAFVDSLVRKHRRSNEKTVSRPGKDCLISHLIEIPWGAHPYMLDSGAKGLIVNPRVDPTNNESLSARKDSEI